MNNIKDVLFTTFERELLLTFLDQLDQIVYKSGIDVKSYVNDNVSEKFQSVVMGHLLNDRADQLDLTARVKELRSQLLDLKAITLTLPFEPDPQKIQEICQKARDVTNLPVIINILVDMSLMGGAIVEGDGRIAEYSFRRYFDRKIEHERSQNGF